MEQQKIIKNAVKCGKCGDVIESRWTHEFKWCSCSNVFVDGGHDYLRRGGQMIDVTELSEYE